MGYTTEFKGNFSVTPTLKPEHAKYLRQFGHTRRMMRNADIAEKMPDPVREATGLPIGREGEYFVGSTENFGQMQDGSVVDFNEAPSTQPGLWCKWVPTIDGTGIQWSGVEKFYDYVEWLEYLIDNFLKPWGYTVSGEVKWRGEASDDIGTITVRDNEVSA